MTSPTAKAVITRADLTPKGMAKMAKWLTYCESIGWPAESMAELERIWLTFNDKDGELRHDHLPEEA